jgi:hypothetical protein
MRYPSSDKSRYYQAYKATCIAFYSDGSMQCRVCGFGNVDALVLDHINDDGYKRGRGYRGGMNFYLELIRDNFPPGIQVLCCNCNWIKEVARRREKRLSAKEIAYTNLRRRVIA